MITKKEFSASDAAPVVIYAKINSDSQIAYPLVVSTTGTLKISENINAGSPQICAQDYLQAVAEGDIAGHVPFAKYGVMDGVQTSLVDIAQGCTNPYVFPSDAGERMRVVSSNAGDITGSAGTGKIKIEYLDELGNSQTTEVTLNGTTAVTTSTAKIRRVNKVYTSLGGVALGNISVYHLTNPSPTYGSIAIGQTQSRQLIYSVPLGKSLFITSVRYSTGVGNTTASGKFNFVTFTNRATVDPGTGALSTIFYPFNEIGLINGAFVLPLEMPTKIPALADLKIVAQGDTALAVRVTAALRGWLE